MMNFLNVKQVNRKVISILCILVFAGVFLYFVDFNNRYNNKKQELDKLKVAFAKVSDYQIFEIPGWFEVPPANISIEELRIYNYLLQNEEDRNSKDRTVEGKYVSFLSGNILYPFESKKVAEKYFSILTDDEKSRFRVVGSSILYVGYNEQLEKVIKEVEILLEKEK